MPSLKVDIIGQRLREAGAAFERMAETYRRARDKSLWLAMKLARAHGDEEWVYDWKKRRDFDAATEQAIRRAQEGVSES